MRQLNKIEPLHIMPHANFKLMSRANARPAGESAATMRGLIASGLTTIAPVQTRVNLVMPILDISLFHTILTINQNIQSNGSVSTCKCQG